ncbi:hypothetical protein D3C72_1805340 [compost metagenome]
MPAARVRKARSRHRLPTRAGGVAPTLAGAAAASPSGCCPSCCGVTENTLCDSAAITATIASPTHSAACAKPACAIRNTHSGENTMPPTLAPL